MKVMNHGGHCCGVKHICGFSSGPDYDVAALTQRAVTHGASAEMAAGKDFYPGPRPQEKGRDRLAAIIEYVDSKKTAQLYEVVLSKVVAANWFDELKKYGFRVVNEFQNSNTDMNLVVFHRVTEMKKVNGVYKVVVREGE